MVVASISEDETTNLIDRKATTTTTTVATTTTGTVSSVGTYGSCSSSNNTTSTTCNIKSNKYKQQQSQHKHKTRAQALFDVHKYNAKDVRFMIMIFTGFTFFVCIVFTFTTQYCMSIHSNNNKQQHQQQQNSFLLSKVFSHSDQNRHDSNKHYTNNNSNDPSISEYIKTSSTTTTTTNNNNNNSNDQSNNSCCCQIDTKCSNDNNKNNIATSCTFRQLGQYMIPIAYNNMIHSIQYHLYTNDNNNQPTPISSKKTFKTTTVGKTMLNDTIVLAIQPPSNVDIVRKQILHVRDLLDIFSPIYPNQTTYKNNNNNNNTDDWNIEKQKQQPMFVNNRKDGSIDVWAYIRKELDIGYTIIGQYQDYDHAHIQSYINNNNNNNNEIVQLQSQIISWSTNLIQQQQNEEVIDPAYIIQYLSLQNIDETTWYIHPTSESHLFWKSIVMEDTTTSSSSHHDHHPILQRPTTTSVKATTILQLLFTKQIDIAKHYYVKAYSHTSVLMVSQQVDYHNLRKILRSIIDVYTMFTSTSRSGCPILLSSINNADISPVSITSNDIDVFDIARQKLGDLNDHWNAYHYYVKKHDYTDDKVIELIETINTEWNEFKDWSMSDEGELLNIFNRILQESIENLPATAILNNL